MRKDNKMEYILGLDIGTTGVKGVLINEKGEIVIIATSEYSLSTPFPNWAEQDPEDWWNATKDVISQIGRQFPLNKIKGIGLTGQMHGAVFLNKDGKVLRPAILWCDQRTSKEAKEIEEIIGKKEIINFTANPPLTGFTAPKILWVRKNEPEIYERTRKILLPKDYIRFRLSGEFASDVTDSSGTSLFDVEKRIWSKEVLERLKIDLELLPTVYESIEITGKISEIGSKETGLKTGTPLVAGAGDQSAAGVGNGVIEEGIISVTLGTSGVVFASTNFPKIDPEGRLHTFCHALPSTWHLMGVMLSAGGSLRWFRDNFCEGASYNIIIEEAKKVPPGSEGIIFLPYLMGERTPHKDPFAKGVIFGISGYHKKGNILRAVMEGITFGLLDSLSLIEKMKVPINQIRLSGGGARSPFWCQMQSDIFGKEAVKLNIEEGSSFGAALLASVGTGIFPSLKDACQKVIKIKETYKPDLKNHSLYQKYYQIYQDLYPALKPSFARI